MTVYNCRHFRGRAKQQACDHFGVLSQWRYEASRGLHRSSSSLLRTYQLIRCKLDNNISVALSHGHEAEARLGCRCARRASEKVHL